MKKITPFNLNAYPPQVQEGISEESITQANIDTFNRLPTEFTMPAFEYFHSESATATN